MAGGQRGGDGSGGVGGWGGVVVDTLGSGAGKQTE